MKARSYVELTGRLVRDPTVKQVGEKTVKEFAIAVDHGRDVSFFDAIVWGEEAEAFQSKVGQWVQVEGLLRQDRWQDKDTGQNRSRVRIHADFAHAIDLTPSKEREDQLRDHMEKLKVGSRVESTIDLPDSSVSRGQRGEVARLSRRTVTVKFDSGARVTLSHEDASNLSLLTPEQTAEREPEVDR